MLTSELQGPGGIPIETVGEIYRFQNQVVLSLNVRASRDCYEKLHYTNIHLPSMNLILDLELLDKVKTDHRT